MNITLWVIMICLIPVAGYLTLFLHEASHMLFGYLYGYEIKAFKPYPHKNSSDKWRFGAVYFSGTVSTSGRGMMLIAPLFKSLIFVIIWIVFTFILSPVFLPFVLWEVIDCMWWFIGYFHTDTWDGGKFRNL